MAGRNLERLVILLLCITPIYCSADDQFSLDCRTTFLSELSYDDLAETYGADNLSTEAIHVGEGIIEKATVLFSTSDRKRLEILWKDHASASNPRIIRVHGKDSEWEFGKGVRLGASLKQLESLNGRSFELMGFGWDYAGTIVDWKGGALEDDSGSPCRVVVRLNTEKAIESATNLVSYKRLVGERVFVSDNPDYLPLEPTVYEIALFYK